MVPQRHERYYFDDGNVIFLVEDTLYNVHRYFLKRDSPVFQTMFSQPSGTSGEGESDDNPITLEGIKSADFANFLSCIYPLNLWQGDLTTYEEWSAALELAVRWEFNSVRDFINGLNLMDKLLAKDVNKGKLTAEQAKEARERVTVVDQNRGITAMRDVDMVIEAASENLQLKQSIFRSISAEVSPSAILASNTSSISITKIAASTIPEGSSAAAEAGKKSASRVVGLHFFNPVPVMKLVELISALQTSQETLDRARAFAVACGKEVTTSQDVPGFVSNALLMPFINEAIMCLEKGTATRDDIDKTLKLGMNHPMGPLQLADL
ncbi:hypothetical protein EVJ58_g4560 [Rhodofomes roseus]|uniref:BTB domain-containing protein n=1 Tax=Rhodofomes roseus TaxID=34475 RepID=A0A4Y9YI13_9APHY|nr:hypothetical protein EVJ58_g4560 [Rhodofomes roseus]